MSRRNPADLWRDLADDAGEDSIEGSVGVSVAQAERDLAAAGFDLAAERAKATAVLETLGGAAPDRGAPRDAGAHAVAARDAGAHVVAARDAGAGRDRGHGGPPLGAGAVHDRGHGDAARGQRDGGAVIGARETDKTDTGESEESEAWVTKAAPRQLRRSARWPLLLAAVLAAAAMGGVLYALGRRSKPIDAPRDVPTSAPPGPSAAPPVPEGPNEPSRPSSESKPRDPHRQGAP
jgi:hypothetical protein